MQDIAEKPSLLRCLTAMLYDAFLVVAVVAVVLAGALGIQVGLLGSDAHELNPWLARLLIAAAVYGFFIVFWRKDGQTLGMQAWRIKLVSFDGGTPRTGQALVRCLGATLSAACAGLGFLWCLFDRNKRFWHDYLSRTELILLPQPAKNASSPD